MTTDERYLAVIVADDLTGAIDSAVCFAKAEFPVDFPVVPNGLCAATQSSSHSDSYLNPSSVHSGRPVLVINTDSRRSPDDFQSTISASLQEISLACHVFKKIDSTLRGNVGSEVRHLMQVLGTRIAILTPAFPKTGRVVRDNQLYVNGLPLCQSELREDFIPSLHTSRIDEIVRLQPDILTRHINLSQFGSDSFDISHDIAQMIENDLSETQSMVLPKKAVCFFDATSQQDLRTIVDVGLCLEKTLGERVLWVGAAGLAEALSHRLQDKSAGPCTASRVVCDHAAPTLNGGNVAGKACSLVSDVGKQVAPTLVINGSRKSISYQQVDVLCNNHTVQKVVVDPHVPYADMLKHASQPWKDGCNIVLTQAWPVVPAADEEVLHTFASLTSQLHRISPVQRMICVGGDTAWQVFKRLGVKRIEIQGEIETAVPYGVLHLCGGENISVVTKGGSIGQLSTLLETYEFLNDYEDGGV